MSVECVSTPSRRRGNPHYLLVLGLPSPEGRLCCDGIPGRRTDRMQGSSPRLARSPWPSLCAHRCHTRIGVLHVRGHGSDDGTGLTSCPTKPTRTKQRSTTHYMRTKQRDALYALLHNQKHQGTANHWYCAHFTFQPEYGGLSLRVTCTSPPCAAHLTKPLRSKGR